MQDRVEIYRRVERQYIRDRLGDMGLQAVDGMVVGLLAREGFTDEFLSLFEGEAET